MTPSRRTLRAWAALLGGPALWFAHFGFVYAAASLEITLAGDAGALSRITILGVTLLVLGMIAALFMTARRTAPDAPPTRAFWIAVQRLLAVTSAIGVCYQAMPALLVAS